MRYVLGPWQWFAGDPEDIGPHWRAPEGCAGCLDLRSIPQQSLAGGAPQGFGLFALRNSAPNPGSSYRPLGRALDDTVSPTTRNLIGSQLGVGPLESSRLNLLLYELLTVKGDHTGENFARPLMPDTRREMTIGLAGELAHRETFRHDSVQHRAARRQLREQYRANRLAESQGRLPPEHHRRVLDFTRKKLGLDWRFLVPPEFTGDPGPLRHRTTITESFNTANSGTLGPDLPWTELRGDMEIVNNEAKWVSATPAVARADSNLSSDDHYAQVLLPAAGRGSGVACRVADANNMYLPYIGPGSQTRSHIAKYVGGTLTTFLNVAKSPAWANGDTLKGESDGSKHTIYFNGSQEGQATDTALTGTLTAGIALYLAGRTLDNFEAADLAAGGIAVLRRRMEAA